MSLHDVFIIISPLIHLYIIIQLVRRLNFVPAIQQIRSHGYVE